MVCFKQNSTRNFSCGVVSTGNSVKDYSVEINWEADGVKSVNDADKIIDSSDTHIFSK